MTKSLQRRSLWIVAALAVALTGCGSFYPESVTPDFQFGGTPEIGVIVGSVTSLPDPTYLGNWRDYSRYEIRSTTDPKIVRNIVSGAISNFLRPWGSLPLCADDGLEAECGHLFAIDLPPGDYVLSAVQPAMAQATSSLTSNDWVLPLEGYRFTVAAGEVRYIGELTSHICVGAEGGWSTGNRVWAAKGEVRDSFARDWPLIARKYPALASLKAVRALISGGPWVFRFREQKGVMPPNGWPKACDLT